jgi:pimeloyl-ACP methyl ester carboxylesterase
VICNEDIVQVSRTDVSEATAGTIFGQHLLGNQFDACAIWPTRAMDAAYHRPVESDVPALVLSGEIDPVTPPSWGEEVVRHLTRGRHVTVPATGHGVISTPCGMRLVEAFLDEGSADGLDTSCVERLRRPPFFVTPAGPEPAPPPPPADAP